MALDNPVQIDKVAVDVVDDLDVCRRTHEIQSRATSKYLDIAGMGRKSRNQMVSKTAFPADPRNNR
jgi:hypothetical protein